jgi:hypothetical protein
MVEAFEQVSWFGLFSSPALYFRWCRGQRILGVALIEKDLIAGLEGAQLLLVQAVCTRPGPFNFRFDFEQETDRRPGPYLLVLFLHEGEFAQMVRVAVRAGRP